MCLHVVFIISLYIPKVSFCIEFFTCVDEDPPKVTSTFLSSICDLLGLIRNALWKVIHSCKGKLQQWLHLHRSRFSLLQQLLNPIASQQGVGSHEPLFHASSWHFFYTSISRCIICDQNDPWGLWRLLQVMNTYVCCRENGFCFYNPCRVAHNHL